MAYTFIYTIVSIAIFSTILILMKNGKAIVNDYKNKKEVRNAFINIYLIAEDEKINRFTVSGNEVRLEGIDGNKEILNIIKLNDSTLTVSYYEKKNEVFDIVKSNTTILKEVEIFKVIKRGEILCVEIKRAGESFLKFI